jgi:hypothetical protein
MPYLTFIPMSFVPAFIDGLGPWAALGCESTGNHPTLTSYPPGKVRLPHNSHLRAACHKNTEANAESKMIIPMANAGSRSPDLLQWCTIQRLQMYYPGERLHTVPTDLGPTSPHGAIDCNAYGASLLTGLSTGLAAAILAAQNLAQPFQANKPKGDWSQLQKDQILKIMGQPNNNNFLTEAPAVWQKTF